MGAPEASPIFASICRELHDGDTPRQALVPFCILTTFAHTVSQTFGINSRDLTSCRSLRSIVAGNDYSSDGFQRVPNILLQTLLSRSVHYGLTSSYFDVSLLCSSQLH